MKISAIMAVAKNGRCLSCDGATGSSRGDNEFCTRTRVVPNNHATSDNVWQYGDTNNNDINHHSIRTTVDHTWAHKKQIIIYTVY